MRFVAASVLGAIVIGICGCGGSSDENRATNGFRLSLAWPELPRDLSAPSSARSAAITLVGAGLSRENVLATVTRQSVASAHSVPVVSTSRVNSGRWLLNVRFFAGVNGTGAEVATSSTDVQVQSDGTVANLDGSPLSGVTLSQAVTSLSILEQQVVPLYQSTVLNTEARDAAGMLVAVPPNAVRFEIDPAEAIFELVGGRVRGLNAGSGTITAVLDGVRSPRTTVDCGLGFAGVTKVLMDPSWVVGSAATERVYAGVASQIGGFPPGIAVINASTGQASGSISFATPLIQFVVHPTGQVAYGLTDGRTAITKFNLVTNTVEGSFTVADGQSAAAIAVSPSDATLVAVSERPTGIGFYRNGLKLSPSVSVPNLAYGNLSYSPDGGKLFATAGGQLYSFAVGLNGITSVNEGGSASAEVLGATANRVFLTNGNSFAAASLRPLGPVSPPSGFPIRYSVDPTGNRLMILTANGTPEPSNPATLRIVDADTLQPTAEVRVPSRMSPTLAFSSVGANRFAFLVSINPSGPGVGIGSIPNIP